MASKGFLKPDGEPGNDGSANVVYDYNWSVSNKDLAMKEVPIILIEEYQQTKTSLKQSLEFYANATLDKLKDETVDPYEKLYIAVSKGDKGNTYQFPFYNTYHHTIANAWGQGKDVPIKGAINAVEDALTKVASVIYPSAGIEKAKTWEGTTAAAYTFSFQLLNTVGDESDIKKNINLIKALVNNNLMDKMGIVKLRPPAICKVSIPGIRGETVAVMSNLSIQNMGQLNYMNIAGITDKLNVPDAYQIDITIQELLTESRQLFGGGTGKVFGGVKSVGDKSLKSEQATILEQFKSLF